MGNRVAGLATALLLLAGQSLSAQYVARVVVTGGAHAGSYTTNRPTSCTLIGGNRVVIADSNAATNHDPIASFSFDATHFSIVFGPDAPATVTPAGYTKTNRALLSGDGTLTLTFQYGKETFTGAYKGMTVVGSDTVRITGTLGCKGAKLEP